MNNKYWLNSATQIPSPNFDERPQNTDVSLIVIHCISLPPGEYGGAEVIDFFQNNLDHTSHPYFKGIKDLEVSSHLYIRRTGELVQFVALDKRAWHAGKSSYKNKERCNDFSIGIELEGTDEDSYTKAQYQSLNRTIDEIGKLFPKIEKNITGHSDIAPGRKTDPGTGFEWKKVTKINQTT